MNKTERVELRIPVETKMLLKASSKLQKLTVSEYIRGLIEKDSRAATHEQQIESAIIGNQLINELLINPEVPVKIKKLIGKEMRKYV